jgi:hypothetical protein
VCGTAPTPAPTAAVCGADDPNLPPEPTFPTDICQTLAAEKSTPDENNLDTARIQAALSACKGRTVKLVSNGANNAFVAGHLNVDSVKLWVDAGTTLYASRNPDLYQKTGSCGVAGINDSGAATSSRRAARIRARQRRSRRQGGSSPSSDANTRRAYRAPCAIDTASEIRRSSTRHRRPVGWLYRNRKQTRQIDLGSDRRNV